MMKHLHIVGICGTFMGNLALLARELGYQVTGSDLNAYPPMSNMLEEQNIEVAMGYHPDNLKHNPDLVIVGNTISRSNPEVDAMLDLGIKYISGPQWLYENVLHSRKVVAVAGTHGKTTTTSMIAWILEYAGYKPGYLIGGISKNFNVAAQVGEGEWFVVEGDEYDTAYFDKRSKFIHYRPKLVALLNLEYDHADIFDSIDDIERQFEFFIRTLPSSGRIIANFDEERLQKTITRSSVTPVITFSVSGNRDADWYADSQTDDYLKLKMHSRVHGTVQLNWDVPGQHNTANALAAVATACHTGVNVEVAVEALQSFKPVRRRLEFLADINNIRIFDDFAHHPTAIRASIDAVSKFTRPDRLVAVFEPRSNTMRMGVHGDKLIQAFAQANRIYMYRAPNVEWEVGSSAGDNFIVHDSVKSLLDALLLELSSGDVVIIMSNGGFDNLQSRLVDRLQEKFNVSLSQIQPSP